MFNILDSVLDFVFSPLIRLNPLLGLVIITLFITIVITVIYKYVSDQKAIKELRDKQKKFSEEIKKYKDNPKKMMEVQKQSMQSSMEMMKHSFKPMIYTFIPIIILFGWLNAHLTNEQIYPDTEFSVMVNFPSKATGLVMINAPEEISVLGNKTQEISEGNAQWNLKGKEGNYLISFDYNKESYTKELKITSERDYKPVTKRKKMFTDYIYGPNEDFLKPSDSAMSIVLGNKQFKFNVLGLKMTWFWTYVILSIVASIIIRKVMKVY